jgi:TRAP-type mannitol/chloroaromatic compound transport system permease small subunit
MGRLNPIDRLSKTVGEWLSHVYLASVAIISYEVVARYFFDAPTIWAYESTISLTAIGFVFGGAYTMQRRGHIAITIVYSLFPPRFRRVLDVLNVLIELFYLSLLFYAGWILAGKSWAVMETSASAWNQPTPVLLKTVLVIGAGLMILQALAQLVQALRGQGGPYSAD